MSHAVRACCLALFLSVSWTQGFDDNGQNMQLLQRTVEEQSITIARMSRDFKLLNLQIASCDRRLEESSSECDCSSASPTIFPISESLCEATCFGATCDDWLSDSADNSCEQSESYGCDCTGCACSAAPPSTSPTASLVCEATCFGATCDDWLSDSADNSCEQSENYGCDCTGCACGTAAPSVSPTLTGGPTASHMPTAPALFEASTEDELNDAIASAAGNGIPFVISVIANLTINSKISLPTTGANIKVIGSLGDSTHQQAFISPSAGHTEGFLGVFVDVELWLENLWLSGFADSVIDWMAIGGNSSLTILRCRFADNQAWYGGAALWATSLSSIVRVLNSEFVDNSSPNGGGAILVGNMEFEGNLLEVEESVFARNQAGSESNPSIGGAIGTQPHNDLRIRSSSFYDNHAYGAGGAVAFSGGITVKREAAELTIISTQFSNNTAGVGGALVAGSMTTLWLESDLFTDNLASETGGALEISSTVATVERCRFDRNRVASGAGGAIAAVTSSTLHIINSNFTRNYASTDGGGVAAADGSWVYPRGATYFAENVAQGGGGGAVSLVQSHLATNDGKLEFFENEARLGGAISAAEASGMRIHPGCRSTQFNLKWVRVTIIACSWHLTVLCSPLYLPSAPRL